ncbi:hypothetical protein MOE86_03520 [Bacillus atrophaeus]|uniref:hypothetical protein n=1 Tax=Bacillus atrophaeus TaxID=1452 RepID=UPI00227E38E3|nr:hypothetical protein [Bacillus atrophaeus]MCY9195798.1 hypothetical protein [Bacillus atrophaeus]
MDLINECRKKVASLAEAWWDWKQDQASEAEPMEKEKPSIPLDENSEYDCLQAMKKKTTRMRANTEQPNV